MKQQKAKLYISLTMLLGLLSCQEVYKEEEFNVIVPVMVQNQDKVSDDVKKSNSGLARVDKKNKKSEGPLTVKQNQATDEPNATKDTKKIKKNLEPNQEEIVSTSQAASEELDELKDDQIRPNKDESVLSSDLNETQNALENKTDQANEIATPVPDPEDALNAIKRTPVDKSVDPREKARRQWLDLKNFASRRGFSQADINHLVPESLSIENYIKFGDIQKTNEKLDQIEEKLKIARVSRGYVKQKYKALVGSMEKSNLSIDERNDFNIRLKQIERAIAQNEFNRVNREINELSIDLGQIKALDQVFEN